MTESTSCDRIAVLRISSVHSLVRCKTSMLREEHAAEVYTVAALESQRPTPDSLLRQPDHLPMVQPPLPLLERRDRQLE